MSDEEILNVAAAIGLGEADAVLQFGREMQAHGLARFAAWCRAAGPPHDRVSWADVAINAELAAAELGAITIT